MCSRHSGETVPPHNCQRNWQGSSKAMEADVGVNLVKEVEDKGVRVDVLVMDDDSITMSKIKQQIAHDVVKYNDQNHTKRNLGSSLYNLQKKHRALQPHVIEWLQYCFSCAVAQNKGSVEDTRKAILQIVPHSFGEHENCSPRWCGFHQSRENYQHSTLEKNLSGDGLRTDLDAVFNQFAANADKIAPGASTQAVESINHMYATKAPKSIHYSGSESLRNRVACGVAQKNMGYTYVCDINHLAGLSPGKVAETQGIRLDRKRRNESETSNTVGAKKRRRDKKMNRRKRNAQWKSKEGVTYQSGIANIHHGDVTEIPPPKIEPPRRKVETGSYNIVVFDIETSSLRKDADILQISAVCGQKVFDTYVTPTQKVSTQASNKTSLTCSGGILFYKGSPLKTVPIKDALTAFLCWLQSLGPSILVGHNSLIFDFPRLLHAASANGLLPLFRDVVDGGADTLPLFRDMYKDRKTYTQESLVKDILHEEYNSHNALEDARSLQTLLTGVDPGVLLSYSFTTEWMIQKTNFDQEADCCIATFRLLVENRNMSSFMARRIGKSGLTLSHLLKVYERGGSAGVEHLLSERINGQVRATKNKSVVSKVTAALSQLSSETS